MSSATLFPIAPSNDVEHLPNFGRPPNIHSPPDLSWIYKDPDEDLDVNLIITRSTGDITEPHDHHWKLSWTVAETSEAPYHRHLDIVQEIGINYLTNWGPLTSAKRQGSEHVICMARMSLRKRQDLEAVAAAEPVRVPDGQWNCQDWLISVLEKAEALGILTHEQWWHTVQLAQLFNF
ncbi:hypothetical protein BDZ89DRAFT_1067082 [Hymenopellis radicata]|nr:hypothetical protein BDZ89DRAFT_1067082 [Hymenopellis radicata]